MSDTKLHARKSDDLDEEANSERLIDIFTVMERCSLSRTHVYKLMRLNQFPKQRRVGGRSVRWVKSEIDLWIEETINS